MVHFKMKISDPGFLLTYALNMYTLLCNHDHEHGAILIAVQVTSWSQEQKSVFYKVGCQPQKNTVIKERS